MTFDAPGIDERYADACRTSDLDGAPTTVIGAAGMASAKKGMRTRIALHIWRLLYANDASEFRPALVGLQSEMAREAKRRRWQDAEPDIIADVCRRVLMHRISDVCPACQGRKYEKVQGQPYLSDNLCRRCGGAGSTNLSSGMHGYSREWKERAEWLDSHVALMLDAACGATLKRIGKAMDGM